MLLSGASGVTVNDNTLTGAGTNVGISVSAGATDNIINFNRVGRTAPDVPDAPTGIGIAVDPGSSATLVCNTFTGVGWNQNIDGAIQIACTPLPDGAECKAYSAPPPTVDGTGTKPFAWSLASGALPPGLSLAPQTGDITGTPPAGSAGTYKFTLHLATANQLMATSDQQMVIAPGCATATPTPVTVPTAPTGTGRQPAAHRRTYGRRCGPAPLRPPTTSGHPRCPWP